VRLRPEQLPKQLQQTLQPVYLVSSDEPLLLQESCDLIRAAAKEQGCSDREVLEVDKSFNWQQLLSSAANMSLFGDRKVIELRIPSGKPGTEGSKALIKYLEMESEDLLLIIAGKIDKASTNSKWFKALDQAGAIVQIWPIDARQLPRWLEQRLHSAGLSITPDALDLLCQRLEGNLLAAVQEVEKLRLLATDQQIDARTVTASVADNARFDLFGMADSALKGDTTYSLRMLHGLRSEGTEPAVILWALSREIRFLHQLQSAAERGENLQQVCRSLRIWDSKAALLKSALSRHTANSLTELLTLATKADGSIKGFADGKPWDNLAALVLTLCTGKPLVTSSA